MCRPHLDTPKHKGFSFLRRRKAHVAVFGGHLEVFQGALEEEVIPTYPRSTLRHQFLGTCQDVARRYGLPEAAELLLALPEAAAGVAKLTFMRCSTR